MVIATPVRVEALVDCSAAALQNLQLPDPADPAASGWTATGATLKGIPPNPAGSVPEIASGDQNDGPARGTAKLFTKQIGNVKCFYLRREAVTATGDPMGTANGVLCFDTTDCSVCAWDKKTKAGDPDPKGTLFSTMLSTSSYGAAGGIDNCSACHVSGITMTMDKMYQQADELALMNTCVTAGGPKWVGAPPGWATQGPANKIPPASVPASCGQSGCHTAGFLKPQPDVGQRTWCGFAGQAFKQGGSMSDYSEDECKSFMDALGCNRSACDPLGAANVPAMSNWSLWGLAVIMAGASLLVIRRKLSCAWS
jgi:hypothetical protein